MNTLDLSMIGYQQALPRPIATAHGIYTQREGFLVHVAEPPSLYGLGDVAPLPGFSPETVNDAYQQALDLPERISHFCEVTSLAVDSPENLSSVMADFWSGWPDCVPSLRFGVETALADLAARRANLPLARWLNPNAASRVPINALLSDDDPHALAEQVHARWAAGYRTFKLKAGIGSVARDCARAAAVHAAAPEARLRVDVNESWNAGQLCRALEGLQGIGLEFIEQPFPRGGAASAHTLCRRFEIKLALDEEVDSMEAAQRLVDQHLCDVLVLKPMILGGIIPCLQIADHARERGIDVIYTSSWESDVGVAATLHLAASWGPRLAAAGLSTAGMIGEGLIDALLAIAGGEIAIRQSPGLGLALAPDVLALQQEQ